MPFLNQQRHLSLVILALLIPASLWAQNSARNDGGISFRILTFERVEGLPIIQWKDEKKSKPVKMHKNNFSPVYRSTSRNLHFFHPTPDAEGKLVSAGSVKVPVSLGKSIILIALPAKGEKYRFLAIAEDSSRFSPGGMKVTNLTKVSIAAIINNKKYKLLPSKMITISSVSAKNSRHSYPVEFYYHRNKKWNAFSSGYWQHQPKARFLTFCYGESKGKTSKIRIRSIKINPRPLKKMGSGHILSAVN